MQKRNFAVIYILPELVGLWDEYPQSDGTKGGFSTVIPVSIEAEK
jgi:hypothetical protein